MPAMPGSLQPGIRGLCRCIASASRVGAGSQPIGLEHPLKVKFDLRIISLSRYVDGQVGAGIVPGKQRINGLKQNSFGAFHGLRDMRLQFYFACEVESLAFEPVRSLHLGIHTCNLERKLAEAKGRITKRERS